MVIQIEHLKELKKLNLTLEQYLILSVLYNTDIDVEDESTKKIIIELEKKDFIRIIDDDIILDPKASILFENNSAAKAKEILEHMNNLKLTLNISKRPFSYRAHGKFINARLSEGISVEDIKSMLDFKYKEWKGTEWQKYLTPATLFSKTNFYKYLEQSDQSSNKKSNSIYKLV